MAKWQGVEAFEARVAGIKAAARAKMADAVAKSANDVRDHIKLAAPENDLDPHPGALRESVHVVDGQTDLFKQVKADAKDDAGEEYGGHVEFGHRTPSGQHVEAHPFFFPTWRLRRRAALSRIARAIHAAVGIQRAAE